MPNVFISYVRQNSDIVDKLAAELRRHDVIVWLDREQLVPGMRWQQAIRKAIRGGDFFLACFSAESVARTRTYQNEELVLAIEELRLRPADRIWFIPALLSPCEVPDRDIGGGETLNSIQWAVLYQDWDEGVRRILKAMGVERKVYEPELIHIPAGEFLMGDDKTPVDVAEFYIGKYPVTNQQYEAFVQANDYELPEHWKRGHSPAGKENHPVVNVSWDDAVAFCVWLSDTTGRTFRLPTEAEWEKAARGGLRIPAPDGALMDNPLPARQYPWGDEFDPEKGNTDESGIRGTTPVGMYSPAGDSPYGVADMAGNVWEWTQERVLRGSSWDYDHVSATSVFRLGLFPSNRPINFGFRVVVVSWRPNA